MSDHRYEHMTLIHSDIEMVQEGIRDSEKDGWEVVASLTVPFGQMHEYVIIYKRPMKVYDYDLS
jgi:hypothetical protein